MPRADHCPAMTPSVRRIFIVLALAWLPFLGWGQGFMQQRADRIERMRVAFITNYVGLTAEESQRFWPIYNEYLRETNAASRDGMLLKAEARLKANQMSDAEIEELLNQILELERKDVEIQERYLAKFKAVLPIRKVALLYPAEREFRRYLLVNLRGGR